MSWLRRLVLSIGLAGCAVFSCLFIASLADPGLVEHAAKEIIRYQVQKKTQEKIDALDEGFLMKRAEVLAKAHAEDIAKTKRLLTEQLPARIASVMAEMQDLDCECRRKIENFFKEGFEAHIKSGAAAEAKLTALIRAKYMETATQLTREFRIFTGTNACVFALLILAVLIRPKADVHLLPATLVLLTATGICAYLYLFNQDWLHTLLFNDYVGFAYLGYLGFALVFLGDIVFNRAHVTSHALSSLLDGLGSSFVVLPC